MIFQINRRKNKQISVDVYMGENQENRALKGLQYHHLKHYLQLFKKEMLGESVMEVTRKGTVNMGKVVMQI